MYSADYGSGLRIPAASQVERDLSVHEEDGVAGDEDAVVLQGDAEDAAAAGDLFGGHFLFAEAFGPEGGELGVGAAGDRVFRDVEFGVEAAGDEIIRLGGGRHN